MSELDQTVMTPLEGVLSSIPFGTHPVGRALIGAALGGAVGYGLKPSMSFDEKGRPRNWIFSHPADPQAAIFPAWAFVVVPSLLLAVFV